MITCRGRNGFFNFHHFEVNDWGRGEITICIYSKKKGKIAPISLHGDGQEIRDLLFNIRHGMKRISHFTKLT